jgi:hypothetical protein
MKVAFADLPPEIRDAFFNGTKRRLTFQQGGYKYESDWKGAVRAMARADGKSAVGKSPRRARRTGFAD